MKVSNQIRLLGALALVFLLVAEVPVMACDPLPWNIWELGKEARALLVGRVIEVSEDGRQAALEIAAYVGPGEAPRRVLLPPTEDGSFATCPDMSVIFKADHDYLVLLAEIPPQLALLRPKGPTAMQVAADGTIEINIVGDREALDSVLSQLSERRSQTVQEPAPGSPEWKAP